MRVLLLVVRRAILVPALAAASAIGVALFVLAVVVTGPVSLVLRGRGRWRAVRLAGFLVTYVALEVVALAGAFAVWVRCGPARRRDATRYQELNFRLIERLLGRLYRAARWQFGLRVAIRAGQHERQEVGPDAVPGPVIILARHAGPGDTFLLVYGLLAHAGRRPLLVLKHMLALDPWIDVLLGRVPHSYVDPGGHDQAVALIGGLAAGMKGRDALVIFPEGGNFTPGRRRRAIEGLRRHGRRRAARQAARLSRVLPPRPSGTLSAIDAAPQADLVIVAHTGLDHLDSAAAVWQGIPLRDPLQVTWWRIPAADVPADRGARTEWLNAQWATVDNWIAGHAPSSSPA